MIKFRCAIVWSMLLLAGCSTVHNPFWRMKPDFSNLPAEALRGVAADIEQAVAEGNREPDIPDRGGVMVNTPEIRQAIRARAARKQILDEFLDTGHAYEKRNGLVYLLPSKEYRKSTRRRQRDRNALLIMNENNDRWTLYEGIIKASNLPPRALSAVQEIFHLARIEQMAPGHKYETLEGEIVEKGAQ